uniref:Heterogeneous nuclear ribonucleoprotein F n=2 Tax=Anthurium amnicola TaxID=1678845 RepID=A0A1D1Z8X1_9ARAE
MSMYGSRGSMLGSGSFLDGYEVGSKRPRMMDSNPYFAVSDSTGYHSSYGGSYGGRESSYGVGLGSYGGGGGGSGGSGGNIFFFPVVRLRGLPFNCTDLDIYRFFTGLDVVDCLLTNKNGRFSGEAFVVFASPMQAEFALQRDRQNMGRRYVEVFRCKKQDYYHAISAEVNEYNLSSPPPVKRSHDDKDQMEYTEILKLRGLPFSATKSDIIEFFGEFELNEDNLHIALRPDGKATGEAYVEFSSAEEAKKAMNKDKMTIGSRYVELFPSTPEEARRAESRSRQ